ncbi:hypothetical protein COHA_009318 [Chlorella ohadii]|uniref:Fungal lipase-like domain-containing protein n=1 Tax=Chlorella ohadii TaxID=2649997 RepID=A0AAD5DFN9_9CHLO|nr:hypothetical protein COHA_009318 [Chlorella ohadii]
MRRRSGVLAALLLLVAVARLPAASALFGWGDDEPETDLTRPVFSCNTVVVRTAYALQFLRANASALDAAGVAWDVIDLGGPANTKLTMVQALPAEVVLAFSSNDIVMPDAWSTQTSEVPFLRRFVYTAKAPTALLDAWAPLGNGTAPGGGMLAEAIDSLMGGQEVLRVVCVGEGTTGGGLATLCGPWAALQYPKANVDVITFATPWEGFNPQFSWAFEQLVTLRYRWPFVAPIPVAPGTQAAAAAVNPLITKQSLPEAVRVPGLPPMAPANLEEPGKRGFDEIYAALVGEQPPEELLPEPSGCPVMFCKTRGLLKGSCLAFRSDSLLVDLPHMDVFDKRSGADAIVAWDNATRTAHFGFKYTEEQRDWVTDAAGIQVTGFVSSMEDLMPHDEKAKRREDSLTSVRGDQTDLLKSFQQLSGGAVPRRVTCSGFSLGGALSELCGVWAAILWPGADITVANQGGPIPGNSEFRTLFQAAVGRAYKINGSTALLQDRPAWDFLDLSWNDHTCDTWLNPEDNTTIIGYVPRLFNITRPTIPGWVYNYSAPTAPPAANASAANRSGLSSAVAALALLAYLLLA